MSYSSDLCRRPLYSRFPAETPLLREFFTKSWFDGCLAQSARTWIEQVLAKKMSFAKQAALAKDQFSFLFFFFFLRRKNSRFFVDRDSYWLSRIIEFSRESLPRCEIISRSAEENRDNIITGVTENFGNNVCLPWTSVTRSQRLEIYIYIYSRSNEIFPMKMGLLSRGRGRDQVIR